VNVSVPLPPPPPIKTYTKPTVPNQLTPESQDLFSSSSEESEEEVEIQPKAGMRSRYSLNKRKKSTGSSRENKPALVKTPPPQLKVPPSDKRKETLEMESESMVVLDRVM